VHPLLGRIVGLTVYLGLWLLLGLAAALSLAVRAGWPWVAALTGVVPLAVVYGVVCLAAWYVCRAFPLQGARSVARVFLAQGAAASLTSATWVGFAQWWLRAQLPAQPFWSRDATLLLFAVGVLLFLFSAAVHYVFIALEDQETARRQALESAVLAREAELRALRAQVNPHFLFNSLHSIGSLAGTRPAAARDMSIALGEFLRQSLRLGGLAGVPLQQEVDLVAQYLAIEQVRFGDRLKVLVDVEPAAGSTLVPPLLLQPLVENAIKHGVAGLLEGGLVSIVARRESDRCVVTVANLFDPESTPRAGTGTGVRNVRDRLAMHFGTQASFEARVEGDCFTVTLAYPCDRAPGRVEERGE
jgi:two-component system, LytTR family, sensor histidine kinase AlgZ